jgi:hypothetical protein
MHEKLTGFCIMMILISFDLEGCACDSISMNGSILGDTVDGPGTLFRISVKTPL